MCLWCSCVCLWVWERALTPSLSVFGASLQLWPWQGVRTGHRANCLCGCVSVFWRIFNTQGQDSELRETPPPAERRCWFRMPIWLPLRWPYLQMLGCSSLMLLWRFQCTKVRGKVSKKFFCCYFGIIMQFWKNNPDDVIRVISQLLSF